MGKHDFDTLADNAARINATLSIEDARYLANYGEIEHPTTSQWAQAANIQIQLDLSRPRPEPEPYDHAAELRKDAEFRSMRVENGDGLYEPVSRSNIWRDGRHGRGHEGL